ncbi:MAG: hypothetical protein JXR91_05855 [Deltaproteobacteria bacterium]|nr:hypothetical protein [Deltaproteobacteria bacterium]
MISEFSNPNFLNTGTFIAVAKFKTAAMAVECQITLSSIFDDIAKSVKDLFIEGNGIASLKQLTQIYAVYGLTNLTGWEQTMDISVSGNDVIWPLPDGMDPAEAEDMIIHLEPQIIEFHDMSIETEQWQLYPLPQLLSMDDTEDLMAIPSIERAIFSSKKTIH